MKKYPQVAWGMLEADVWGWIETTDMRWTQEKPTQQLVPLGALVIETVDDLAELIRGRTHDRQRPEALALRIWEAAAQRGEE